MSAAQRLRCDIRATALRCARGCARAPCGGVAEGEGVSVPTAALPTGVGASRARALHARVCSCNMRACERRIHARASTTSTRDVLTQLRQRMSPHVYPHACLCACVRLRARAHARAPTALPMYYCWDKVACVRRGARIGAHFYLLARSC
eukprot:4928157-Pleurochrysis_carterae.AAC.2